MRVEKEPNAIIAATTPAGVIGCSGADHRRGEPHVVRQLLCGDVHPVPAGPREADGNVEHRGGPGERGAQPAAGRPVRGGGAGVALLATVATVLSIELWCARDVPSSFVRPRDLARMAVSNVIAVAVSAGCAWLLATAFSVGPGVIAIAGLLICSTVDIAVAVALRDDTAPMLVGKARVVLRCE